MKDGNRIVALAVPGVACVAYGMVREDHPVFVIGLALGIAAYLLFRKRLKEDIREKVGKPQKPSKQE
jgi:hypothetical protein